VPNRLLSVSEVQRQIPPSKRRRRGAPVAIPVRGRDEPPQGPHARGATADHAIQPALMVILSIVT
jgi:hypothetical protein